MSERAKIDKESGEHRETTDPSREEQLSLLQTITMEVAAARDFSSALEVVLRRICEKTAGCSDRLGCQIKMELVLTACQRGFARRPI